MYKLVHDDDLFKDLVNKSKQVFSDIYKDKYEITAHSDYKSFLKAQKILNEFCIYGYSRVNNNNNHSIYILNPAVEPTDILTVIFSLNGFTWDVNKQAEMPIETFISDYLIHNSGFATHKDQEGFLWKPAVFTSDWYCFVNDTWALTEVEDYIVLTKL